MMLRIPNGQKLNHYFNMTLNIGGAIGFAALGPYMAIKVSNLNDQLLHADPQTTIAGLTETARPACIDTIVDSKTDRLKDQAISGLKQSSLPFNLTVTIDPLEIKTCATQRAKQYYADDRKQELRDVYAGPAVMGGICALTVVLFSGMAIAERRSYNRKNASASAQPEISQI